MYFLYHIIYDTLYNVLYHIKRQIPNICIIVPGIHERKKSGSSDRVLFCIRLAVLRIQMRTRLGLRKEDVNRYKSLLCRAYCVRTGSCRIIDG